MKILIVIGLFVVVLVLLGGLCLAAALMDSKNEDIDPDYHP
jgi:uncharacterized membrane protein